MPCEGTVGIWQPMNQEMGAMTRHQICWYFDLGLPSLLNSELFLGSATQDSLVVLAA